MENEMYKFDSKNLVAQPGQKVTVYESGIKLAKYPSKVTLYFDSRFKTDHLSIFVSRYFTAGDSTNDFKTFGEALIERMIVDNKIELTCYSQGHFSHPEFQKCEEQAFNIHLNVSAQFKNVTDTEAVLNFSIGIDGCEKISETHGSRISLVEE